MLSCNEIRVSIGAFYEFSLGPPENPFRELQNPEFLGRLQVSELEWVCERLRLRTGRYAPIFLSVETLEALLERNEEGRRQSPLHLKIGAQSPSPRERHVRHLGDIL